MAVTIFCKTYSKCFATPINTVSLRVLIGSVTDLGSKRGGHRPARIIKFAVEGTTFIHLTTTGSINCFTAEESND